MVKMIQHLLSCFSVGRYKDDAMVNMLKESGAKRPPGTAPRRASILTGGGRREAARVVDDGKILGKSAS